MDSFVVIHADYLTLAGSIAIEPNSIGHTPSNLFTRGIIKQISGDSLFSSHTTMDWICDIQLRIYRIIGSFSPG